MVTLTSSKTDSTWTLDIESAKILAKALKGISTGSYEYAVVLRPIRRAIRAKRSEAILSTAGFGTSAVARILDDCSIKYECK